MIVIGLFIYCLSFIILSAKIDAEHLKDNDYIESHDSRWLLRSSYVLTIALYSPWGALASVLLFTALFDQVFNWMMGKSFWYLGTVAKWDIFFTRNKWLYIILKSVCLFSSLLLYTFIFIKKL